MKVLYLGLYHNWNDARLYHRQMKMIYNNNPDIDFYFITNKVEINDFEISTAAKSVPAVNLMCISSPDQTGSANQRLPFFKSKLRLLKMYYRVVKNAVRISPDVIQASDVREIIPALFIKFLCSCNAVYDAHEDYFTQIYEYNDKTKKAFIRASIYNFVEWLFVRFFNYVCYTDDYLSLKFSRRHYGIKKRGLLRNFIVFSEGNQKSEWAISNGLKLLYIGSINKYRGVIESAEFVHRYNSDPDAKGRISLHIYSNDTDILKDHIYEKEVFVHGVMEYDKLMERIRNYDVGVCLWQYLKKFERNLPIKNFEYMAVGLPVLTSNFGNLKKYIVENDSGITINPSSYTEFHKAVNLLFSEEKRVSFGKNGINYVSKKGNFQVESERYVNFILDS